MFAQELNFFIRNQDELVRKYLGKALVIKGNELYAVYDTALEAYVQLDPKCPGSRDQARWHRPHSESPEGLPGRQPAEVADELRPGARLRAELSKEERHAPFKHSSRGFPPKLSQ